MLFCNARCFGVAVISVMFLSGCKDVDHEQGRGQSSGGAKEKVIPSTKKKLRTGKATNGWKSYMVNDAKIKWADVDFILHGVARKQFGNLDAMVKNFDETYSDGNTYRAEFYRKFLNYGDYNKVDSGAYHDQYVRNLELWRDMHPEMGAPVIALAGFEVNRAWFSRGSGFIDTVSKKGWEGFQYYLAQARKRLEDAPAAAKEDPYYYVTLLRINLGEEASLEEMQKVFEAGQDKAPTFENLYFQMTRYLQPRWAGSNFSDWGLWLDLALKHPKLSKEDALVLYGEVVRYNISYQNDDPRPEGVDFYEFYGVDSKRFMEGLSACCKRYKDSSTWPSSYFYHACMASDEDAIREALALMDFKFDPRVVSESHFFNLLNKVEEIYPDALPKTK